MLQKQPPRKVLYICFEELCIFMDYECEEFDVNKHGDQHSEFL